MHGCYTCIWMNAPVVPTSYVPQCSGSCIYYVMTAEYAIGRKQSWTRRTLCAYQRCGCPPRSIVDSHDVVNTWCKLQTIAYRKERSHMQIRMREANYNAKLQLLILCVEWDVFQYIWSSTLKYSFQLKCQLISITQEDPHKLWLTNYLQLQKNIIHSLQNRPQSIKL